MQSNDNNGNNRKDPTYGMFHAAVQYNVDYVARREREEIIRLTGLVRHMVRAEGMPLNKAIHYITTTFRLDTRRARDLVQMVRAAGITNRTRM